MVGRILGNRYELLEKVGGGGMALVYKARCRMLNRYVAVKVLRPEFINDEEFVKRFRMEAQSAASLSHPNVVSVYDVGQDNEIHYIVMEFIDGITLKEYITEHGAIPWKEAVNLCIQVCSAIEHAHRNHIVHRDIKPHNIILTKDGIAKVADFGIARAVTASTMTMAGSTIGSVHYFSPEQARGGYVDEKSDIYSLGIALYEMVTGRLPFNADTPVSVALKHIQEEAVPPVEILDDIPPGVNDIILKAIRKDVAKRYRSASEMVNDLNEVLRNPDALVVDDEEDECPTRRITAVGSERYMDKYNEKYNDKYNEKYNGKYNAKHDGGNDELAGSKANSSKGRRKDRTVPLAILTSIVILAGLFYVGVLLTTNIFVDKKVEFKMPNLVGQNLADMKGEYADKFSFDVVNEVYSDEYPKGAIILQKPDPDISVKTPRTVEVTLSLGQKVIVLDDYTDTDYRDAEMKLRDLGLVTKVAEEFSDKPIGYVIRTEPGAREEVKPNDIVTIVKSKGPEVKMTKVPNLVGKNIEEAKQMLLDARLVPGKETDQQSEKNNIVLSQSVPAATEVEEGRAVDLTVGKTGSYKDVVINLPKDYAAKEDKVKVKMDVYFYDDNRTETQFSDDVNVKDFPRKVRITGKGKVHILLYMDDMTKIFAEMDTEIP